jgi:trk system potassium uptake protein TrkH
VIRPATLLHILGRFLLALGVTMLVPLTFTLKGDGDPRLFGYAFLITAGTGVLLLLFSPARDHDLTQREGLLLVCLIWFLVALFGALPFYLSPHFESFSDAFFESASGFTTTGATILTNVEVLPEDLQFWRCFTHWLGGMGIVLLGIAILPLLGIGGMPLYRAEFSGAKSEKLKPRITETALALWKIYFALTLAEYAALRIAGMEPFDAICHCFSTLGTGGFSTRTASISAFNSPAIEYIIIIFMLLAGINFTRHYQLWVERKPSSLFADVGLRFYLGVAFLATTIIFSSLLWQSEYEPALAIRKSLFQVSSILTTTGFVTDNFELWLPLPQLILLALMFMGGCTGSTAGGMKASRILLLFKMVGREFKRMVERRGVFAVRLGKEVIPETAIQSLLNMVYLAFLVFFLSCLLLAASGIDVLTCIAAVTASMFNIGPGLGSVGPVENYAHLPVLAKWVLTICMFAGRLEFYTLIVILTPAFWRK